MAVSSFGALTLLAGSFDP